MTQMNLSTKQTRRHKEETGGCSQGEKLDWKFETSTCKLLDIHVTRLLCCISESNTAILQ